MFNFRRIKPLNAVLGVCLLLTDYLFVSCCLRIGIESQVAVFTGFGIAIEYVLSNRLKQSTPFKYVHHKPRVMTHA
jgi:hypothetical protein